MGVTVLKNSKNHFFPPHHDFKKNLKEGNSLTKRRLKSCTQTNIKNRHTKKLEW